MLKCLSPIQSIITEADEKIVVQEENIIKNENLPFHSDRSIIHVQILLMDSNFQHQYCQVLMVLF